MASDAWLPRGFEVSAGARLREIVEDDVQWQIYATARPGERALVAHSSLAVRWQESDLLPDGALTTIQFGEERFGLVLSAKEHALTSITRGAAPQSAAEALAFAASLQRARSLVPGVSLHDSVYAERFTILLPTYSMSPSATDDIVLGRYLSGGVEVSCRSTRRLNSMLTWLPAAQLSRIVEAAGLAENGLPSEVVENTGEFVLPGRPVLESFFREHVIDVVQHQERYRALGIDGPSAMILHGPPGCGKTFAVERLVECLGWPIYQVSSGTVGSPYIHETGRKIADLFETALKNAPAVIVIDEMESFLADREYGAGGSGHRVEEVAEFLRRIPEAVKGSVLVIGMTNRVDMIDPAILRRGRFDHIIEVPMPTEAEVGSLLVSLLSKLPTSEAIDTPSLARRLAGRPLSDAAFVVREAGRLAAKAGKHRLTQDVLEQALADAPSRSSAEPARSRIGFV